MTSQRLHKILRRYLAPLLLVLLSLMLYRMVTSAQKEISYINLQIQADLQNQTEQIRKLELLRPHRKKGQPEPEFTARSVISVLIYEDGREKILFEKNIDQALPIASVSKIMTAYVSLDSYDSSDRVNDFLHSILIASNNWTAQELAQMMGQEEFVVLMNLKAQELGLNNTHFINPTGLDSKEGFNYSTARDLVDFAVHIFEKKPVIWRISILQDYRNTINTNRLLGQVPGIIGGKTGVTLKAGECFLLLVESPDGKGYIVNVILGSANRFSEAEELLQWVTDSYIWQ